MPHIDCIFSILVPTIKLNGRISIISQQFPNLLNLNHQINLHQHLLCPVFALFLPFILQKYGLSLLNCLLGFAVLTHFLFILFPFLMTGNSDILPHYLFVSAVHSCYSDLKFLYFNHTSNLFERKQKGIKQIPLKIIGSMVYPFISKRDCFAKCQAMAKGQAIGSLRIQRQ